MRNPVNRQNSPCDMKIKIEKKDGKQNNVYTGSKPLQQFRHINVLLKKVPSHLQQQT